MKNTKIISTCTTVILFTLLLNSAFVLSEKQFNNYLGETSQSEKDTLEIDKKVERYTEKNTNPHSPLKYSVYCKNISMPVFIKRYLIYCIDTSLSKYLSVAIVSERAPPFIV